MAGLEIPDGGVEAIDAVERATGNIDGVAHAFAVGDDEGLVVGNHALSGSLYRWKTSGTVA